MQPLFASEAEFTNFFSEHYQSLVLYSFRFTNDQQAAEDIAEDAFINLWKRKDRPDEIRSVKAYLYTMARNGSLSWIRKCKRETLRHLAVVSMEDEFEKTALENLIYAETMSKIYAVMDKLPMQCRRVFVKHYIEGKKLSEIAKEMNISIGTVKTHKVRGIILLQKAFLSLFFWIFLTR